MSEQRNEKAILLRLDAKLHRKLKALAVKRETTMTALVRDAVVRLVKEGR